MPRYSSTIIDAMSWRNPSWPVAFVPTRPPPLLAVVVSAARTSLQGNNRGASPTPRIFSASVRFDSRCSSYRTRTADSGRPTRPAISRYDKPARNSLYTPAGVRSLARCWPSRWRRPAAGGCGGVAVPPRRRCGPWPLAASASRCGAVVDAEFAHVFYGVGHYAHLERSPAAPGQIPHALFALGDAEIPDRLRTASAMAPSRIRLSIRHVVLFGPPRSMHSAGRCFRAQRVPLGGMCGLRSNRDITFIFRPPIV